MHLIFTIYDGQLRKVLYMLYNYREYINLIYKPLSINV